MPDGRCGPNASATNSSPPMRATKSSARRVECNRCAAARITASPAWCPNPSLIVLTLSRSMNSTAARVGESVCSARDIRASAYARLGSPVSES